MSKSILLIDDDAYFRDFYGGALQKAGFTVAAAENGEEALEKLKHNTYDLLVVDLVMPLMSGSAFLKAVKGHKIPRIVLSTLGGKTDKADAKKEGAEQYLEKSQTTPTDLVKEIKRILGV